MLPQRKLDHESRSISEIVRLIEVYPKEYRRWCSAPENGGCFCQGCVRHPAPSTVRGDPEGQPWLDESKALSSAEVAMYQANVRGS
jgi:hypothetical protein